jgi:hypothetical protein
MKGLKRGIIVAALLMTAAPGQARMVRMCDVTCSGQITTRDATFVLRYVAGLSNFSAEEQMLADATGDGKVTAFDAACILKHAKHMPVPGSTCGKLVEVED